MPQAIRYADLLAGPGVERGLIGPAEAGRLWERHLLNCAAIAPLAPECGHIVDVGSGAGLPGIVLALLVPSARITLVDSLARRVTFLDECVVELGLVNVEVRRARAEDLVGTVAADMVTARAVAPLEKLAAWCVGLLAPGGRVVAMKGSSAAAELARARPALARLGVTDAEVMKAGSAGGPATATVVVFTATPRRPEVSRGRSGRGKAGSGEARARAGDGGPGGSGGRQRAGRSGPVADSRGEGGPESVARRVEE